MKVLYVNLDSTVAGAERSLILLVQQLSCSVKAVVACPNGKLFDQLANTPSVHAALPACVVSTNKLLWSVYLLYVNFRLLVIIRKFKPDLIHANSGKALLASGLACVILRVKIIWHARDISCHRLIIQLSRLFGFPAISVSDAVRNALVKAGLPGRNIEVVHNGVSDRPRAVYTQDNNSREVFTFAHIGQFVPWKNHRLFIEAAEALTAEDTLAEFMIIGDDVFGRDDEYKRWLLNRVDMSFAKSNIRLTGWQDSLDQHWRQIDCLVHTADYEPFGRVLAEAMVNAVPVIAPACGGPAEIITHAKTGLLFKPGSIEDLVQVMKKIASSKHLADRLKENAKKHVLANFRAKDTADKTKRIYQRLMADQ